MKSVAIITARGGSKRVPKKNIRLFCGKPMLCYAIEAAQKAEAFDEVMVSTDSEEIAAIAKEYNARVPFMRSEKTSDDFATTRDVLLEVLEEYGKRNVFFEKMCCLYPTAPFLIPQRVKAAMDLLNDPSTEAVMPVVQYSFPPLRSMVLRDGKLEYRWPEYVNYRSQDLEPIYHDVGQFYCYRVKSYLENQIYRYTPIVLPESEVQDIDTEEDWKIAEMKYRILHENISLDL